MLDVIGAKADGGGGDNWSCKKCEAPVKSLPPTNQHPDFYRPDAFPVAQPTVSEQRTNGNRLAILDFNTARDDGAEVTVVHADRNCKMCKF